MDLTRMQVEVYSGYTYAQEPRALVWQGQRYRVARIEQRWRTPEGSAFHVATEPGGRFEIEYHIRRCEWSIRPLTGAGERDTATEYDVPAKGAVAEQ
jgi:hypothetical protein